MQKKRKSNVSRLQPEKTLFHSVKPYIALIIIFIISRTFYYFCNIRFDAFEGEHLLHFLSKDLLKNNLIQSLFYLHIQPPAFNLFIGIILKLFPEHTTAVFHIVYLLLGISLSLSLYYIMTVLGVSDKISGILTIIFMVSPSCILFENLLLYTYPITTFLCLASVFLFKYFQTQNLYYGVLFFFLLFVVVLTRSFFHLFWLLSIIVFILLVNKKMWRQVVVISCIPLIFATSVYVKNAYFFGDFTSSSWLGMSFSKLTTFKLPEEERISLVQRGELSELALLAPFKSLWYYRQHIDTPTFPKTDIPVLDLEFFPNEGNNWNNLSYYSISRQYLKDALYVLKKYPSVYFGSFNRSLTIYFFPASDWFNYFPSVKNIQHIGLIDSFYNKLFYGQILNFSNVNSEKNDFSQYFNNASNAGIFIVLCFLIAVLYGILRIIREIKSKQNNIPLIVTLIFIVFNIFYVTVVSCALETGENERFRFNIDPFILLLFSLFLQQILQKFNVSKNLKK